MNILVTGAGGFIGSGVVRGLLKHGHKVRVLLQKGEVTSNLQNLPVEILIGDIRDKEVVTRAVGGMDIVFHAAAIYQAVPFYEASPREMYSVNIEGTRNVCEAALEEGVRRVIYTSTTGTIGKRVDGLPADESVDLNLLKKRSHYEQSKAQAEKVFLSYHKQGLEVVSINPSFTYGPRDSRPSPTGELIVKFLNKRYPFYFDAIACVTSLEMVVDAHIKAMTLGQSGKRYIVAHKKHYTLKEIFNLLADLTGIQPPCIKAPIQLVYWMACLEELFLRIFRLNKKAQPVIASEFVRYFTIGARYDASCAIETFNLKEPDFKETLKEAVDWYTRSGYIK